MRKAKAMGMANQLTMIFYYKKQESVKISEEMITAIQTCLWCFEPLVTARPK